METEDDDLDEEDRAALEAAVVTLAEAVGTAVAEVGGGLDDVELDDEDGTWVWDVSLDDTDNGNEVDVKVGTTTGEVVSSEG
ncbi:PepSY domain-containing protein [Ornithinimicrobium sp. W1665]|uniref:PepSY domain-containing protein n=1 Tax=Ornithinimicrobium sp. W1665 TaxID=3416666 RepID=UPI003D6B791A